MKWEIYFTKQARKDAKKVTEAGLKTKVEKLLKVVEKNPNQNPPPYEKLKGDLAGAYSRRINVQHRLVYQIIEEKKVIKVIRLWTHYE